MGMFEPNVEDREVRSQATPLAQDILGMLRAQIQGGTFGEGFGPNREIGTQARQFVSSLQDRVSPGVRDVPTIDELAPAITARHERTMDRNAADLREGMGIAGSRFGSSAARGEGLMRAEGTANLDAILAELTQSLAGLGVQRDVAAAQTQRSEDEMILQGLMSLFGMNQANIQPAFGLAQMGINPDAQVVTDSPWATGFKVLGDLLAGAGKAASGGAALAG